MNQQTGIKLAITGIGLIVLTLSGCATEQRYQGFIEQTVEGLERVESQGVDIAYVRPGVDFSEYNKVMIKSVEVRFRNDWAREHPRITLAEQQRIKQGLTELFHDTFRDVLETEGGIPIVTEPGPDVLAMNVELIDLYITEVDTLRGDSSRVYVTSAGSVTLIGELQDSVTDAVLARVADHKVARTTTDFEIANRVTNSVEARRALRHWASLLRERLNAVNQQ